MRVRVRARARTMAQPCEDDGEDDSEWESVRTGNEGDGAKARGECREAVISQWV
jgi:hypothetical protein